MYVYLALSKSKSKAKRKGEGGGDEHKQNSPSFFFVRGNMIITPSKKIKITHKNKTKKTPVLDAPHSNPSFHQMGEEKRPNAMLQSQQKRN